MTTSELAAVESLLMKVLPDPLGFAERIIGELAERLATPVAGGPNVVPGYPPPSYAAEPDAAAHPAHAVLVDRQVLLAAALGACDCWGEDVDCPECGGKGSAGWVPPDPELFAEYVVPAVRRTAGPSPVPEHAPAPAPQEEPPDGGDS